MQSGWVKIHRKIMDSSVWGDTNTFKVWMWCLLRAGHKESKIMFAGEEITVPIGAFISGRASGSTECNMPQSTFRNAVQRLVKLGMISLKSDNKKSLYLVVKYMDYQILTCETGQQEDSKRTTTGQQEDTNKNEELSIKKESSSLGGLEPPDVEDSPKLQTYVDQWNAICGDVQEIKRLGSQRKKHLQARLKERLFVDNYESMLRKIAASDFASGRITKFKADFDWIIKNDSNYIKVVEGKYDNKSTPSSGGIYHRFD